MHSIINAQDEKYQENLSDIKRIIKYYKSGNIYYCDEQKNFLTSITTQEQKYCSKKCERDSQLY